MILTVFFFEKMKRFLEKLIVYLPTRFWKDLERLGLVQMVLIALVFASGW